MGGTASGLIWAVVYDPVITLLGRILGIDVPIVVDDSAALVEGFRQTRRVMVLLMALSYAAGLHADTHTCQRTEVRGQGAWGAARGAFGRLPLRLSR